MSRGTVGSSGSNRGVGGGDGRKPGTKICPTCHGSGRVPSGKTGSAKGKPGAISVKKPAAKKTRR